eukprot:UN33446
MQQYFETQAKKKRDDEHEKALGKLGHANKFKRGQTVAFKDTHTNRTIEGEL